MLDKLAICELLGIKYPIIQGGMARLGTAELVSAVSEAGGLGVIGSGDAPPEWLKGQIKSVRERTDKPFAVNVMLTSPFLEDTLRVVIEEGVGAVALGGGNPGVYIPRLKEAGTKVIPVVSTVALARRVERFGIDAIVAEGMESGGHVGDTTTMALLPQVVDAVKVPVIAAGGIADGRGLVAAFSLGAQGVQMGTRFVCSSECVAHEMFKERILSAQDRMTVVIGKSIGHPTRCIENRMSRSFAEIEKAGASEEELEELIKGRLFKGVIEGNLDEGVLMAGQISGLIKEVKPVKNIIEDIVAEAQRVLEAMAETT